MSESSKNSLFGSLKGTILVCSGGLALFLGIFIPVSYLGLAAITDTPPIAIGVTSLISLSCVAGLGWWISNKVSESLNQAVLTAKTLERGNFSSLPKESGAAEVDELISTLQRISNQIQRVSTSIEEISNGNLATNRASGGNDRIGNSLNKLVAKIADAIKAEKDFNKLRTSLRRLGETTTSYKRGDFSIEVAQTYDDSKDIVATLNIVTNELRDLIKDVRVVSDEAKNSAFLIQDRVGAFAQSNESKTKEIAWASNALRAFPEMVSRISEDLAAAGTTSIISLEQIHNGSQMAQQAVGSINQLRQMIGESVSRLQKLNEQTQEILKVASLTEDLANRTNLVALNASIQATSGTNNQTLLIVAEEVEKLANRATQANRHVSSLSKSFQAEVAEFESILGSVSRDITGVSRLTQQSGVALQELEGQVSEIAGIHEKIMSYSQNKVDSAETSFEVLNEVIKHMTESTEDLRNSEKHASQIAKSMETLGMTISGFKLPQASSPAALPEQNNYQENYSSLS